MPDFEDELKRAADTIKATVEAISAVEGLLGDAARSVVVEVNNTTTRDLRLADHFHEHGAFAEPPREIIKAGATGTFGSRSSSGAIFVGTTGTVIYDVLGTDIFYTIGWVNPFIGSNEANSSLEGVGTDLCVKFDIAGGGDKNAHMRYMIGEKIASADRKRDFRMCEKCKTLYFAPSDLSDCPAGGRHAHNPQSFNFRLPHGIAGLSHQAGWCMCLRCLGIFFDEIPSTKGICPSPVPPFHRGEAPEIFLSHAFRDEDLACGSSAPTGLAILHRLLWSVLRTGEHQRMSGQPGRPAPAVSRC